MLRKYGVGKRNPNPPWPNEQSVVVVPAGVKASAVGKHGEKVRSVSTEEATVTANKENQNRINENTKIISNEIRDVPQVPEDRNRPLKQYIPETSMRNSDYTNDNIVSQNMPMGDINTDVNTGCSMMAVSNYLFGQIGKLIRVEFLFGENTHIEKTGVLQSVGKDFMVISETGTNNSIVCSVKNIKFINVYNFNAPMTLGGFGSAVSEL
ncbi:MAG: hypothetical protein IKW64_07200 [Clostridia bacterium]|nr:hypothetical protein [Clostridia bacterium]